MKIIAQSLGFGFLLAAAAAAGQGAVCSSGVADIPVSFTFSSTYTDGTTPSAVYADAGGAYINGKNGVTAYIRACSGSNDATLDTGKRKLGFSFVTGDRKWVYDPAGNQPTWTKTPQLLPTFLDINNLLWACGAAAGCSNTPYTFTTQMNSGITGPDRLRYHLKFWGATDTHFLDNGPSPNYDAQHMTSAIVVEHFPANPSENRKEYWLVYPSATPPPNEPADPAPTQIGGLLVDQNNGSTVNVGQYSMPFLITITRL